MASLVEKNLAWPPIITLSDMSLHSNLPPLLEICNASKSFFKSLDDQNGIKVQWAEPVTGSSKIVACGVKNLETKSTELPLAVIITPPQPKLIWSKNCLLILISRKLKYYLLRIFRRRNEIGV